eukprot:8461956-Alexandrium_andersonii.AAC.1
MPRGKFAVRPRSETQMHTAHLTFDLQGSTTIQAQALRPSKNRFCPKPQYDVPDRTSNISRVQSLRTDADHLFGPDCQ